MAIKYFCDHCGREIVGNKMNEIGTDDVEFDTVDKTFPGAGSILCDECFELWTEEKIKLARRFFFLEDA